MKKRISDLQEQLKRVMKLYEIYENEKGELIRNIVTKIKLDEELDNVKKILDMIEERLREEMNDS